MANEAEHIIAQAGGKQGLFFIPDISGFTNFINDVDAVHSTHIISELLDVIIDSADLLNLKAEEIEGDAVLFYGDGPAPAVSLVYQQVEKMFLAFHRHLKLYERDRICDCGSCGTANDLTLKVVVHYGGVVKRQIRNLTSLLGPDVTLAHRLMKNSIDGDEYVLFSDAYLAAAGEISPAQYLPNYEREASTYEGIGEVTYGYTRLRHLYAKVEELPPRLEVKRYANPLRLEETVNAPLSIIKDMLMDLEARPEWSFGLKSVTMDENRVERVGTIHNCILGAGNMNVETADYQETENGLQLAERVVNHRRFSNLTTIWIVTANENGPGYRVMVEWHIPKEQARKSGLITRLIAPLFGIGLRISMRRFRRLAEARAALPVLSA